MTQKGNPLSRKTVLTALTAAALALVVAGPHAAAAGQSSTGTSSAFALSASGLFDVPPQAALDDRNGFRQVSVSSTRLPEGSSPVVSTGVLDSEVDRGRARASAADLAAQLGSLKVPGEVGALTAEAVSATCVNGEGRVVLAGARMGGAGLDVAPAPNSAVGVPGVASVVLNKQTRAADGTLTVVAVAIEVAGSQRIDIASATCGRAAGRSTPTTTGTTTPTSGKAPRPTAVEGHLAVTG